jgi:hypothetical protein
MMYQVTADQPSLVWSRIISDPAHASAPLADYMQHDTLPINWTTGLGWHHDHTAALAADNMIARVATMALHSQILTDRDRGARRLPNTCGPLPTYAPPGGIPLATSVVWNEVFRVFVGLSSLGVYSPKLVPGTTCWSMHAWALAIDFGGSLHSLNELGRYLVANAARLRVSQVFHNGRVWQTGTGWTPIPSNEDQHLTHLHVSITPFRCDKPPWL